MTDEAMPTVDRRRGWWARAFEDANGIPDDARVIGAVICVWFMVLTTAMCIALRWYDPLRVGGGIAAVTGGIAAWFGFRKEH